MLLAGLSWMTALGPGGTLWLLAHNALAASTACRVTDGWFSPRFSVFAEFSTRQWTAEVSCPRVTQPVWPACWIDTPDRSSSSTSEVVQDIWDVYREEMGTVPPLALRSAIDANCIDRFRSVWSASAEAKFLGAYRRAGGPITSGIRAFLRRGVFFAGPETPTWWQGCWVSHGDVVDVSSAQYSVNSSLSPVLLLLRRVKSWRMFSRVSVRSASLRVGGMLCVVGGRLFVIRGFVGPCVPLSLGPTGFHLMCTDFITGFLMLWACLPPSPFLVVKDKVAKTSQILVQLHLVSAEFRKSWHPVVTSEQFLDFVDPYLAQEPVLDLPRITGQDLQEVARAKKSTAGCLDGWAWNEINALLLAWFSGLDFLLNMVEDAAVWPQELLDAYIAMTLEVDGNSTPLGQRPLCVVPLIYRLCAWLCAWPT